MKTLTDDLLLEIFNKQIGTLSFDACFKRGFEAAQQNEQESDNPFKANTKEAKFWADGWWDGFYEVPTQERHLDDVTTQERHPDDAKHPSGPILQDVAKMDTNDSHSREGSSGHSREGGNPGKKNPYSKWIAFAATAVAVSVIAVNFVDFAA